MSGVKVHGGNSGRSERYREEGEDDVGEEHCE